ncbi:MAG: hypothetical protein JRI23_02110 [Deltaproteobacteria bacterium]|nr:hypothetical protein [Deltaproteobacteria bacterium]MBW2530273.1 hypothetical protein [Deltaproteobacteria bacterium]
MAPFAAIESATVLSRYQLVRQLAQGRSGAVWLARDGSLSREVAAKIMDPQAADSPEALGRFKREAMAVARLGSSNAVQIFDYGVEQGCPVIVMELLKGEDMGSLLAHKGRLDPILVARIVSGVGRALTMAH